MRRQTDQAKIGSRANPTTSNKRLMRWRISLTLRSTIGRDGASSPPEGGEALSLTRMATRKARASMASVMWRYQPCQERTSSSSRPTSCFGHLEAFLDRPAHACDPCQRGKAGVHRIEDHVIRDVVWILAVTPDQQPVLPVRLHRPWSACQAQAGPVVEAFALGPGAGRVTPPGAGRTGCRQLGRGIPARLVLPHRPQLFIAAYRQHVSLLTLLQRRAQFAVRTIDFVAQHPGAGNPRIERADDHLLRQGWLGGEDGLVRDGHLFASRGVCAPSLGQIERAVDQRVAFAAGIGEEHANLAVINLPRGAAVLPRHPSRVLALLSNFGPVVLTDFGPPPVPQPTVPLMDQGTLRGLESQSGFIRATPSGA